MSTAITEPAADDDGLTLLTTEEAAAILRVGQEWVQRQCKAGVIPARKLGRDWRITRAALREFMAAPGTVPSPRTRLTARQRRRSP